MKKFVVGIASLGLCSSVFAAAPYMTLREVVADAQVEAVQGTFGAAYDASANKVERPRTNVELGAPPANDECNLATNPLLPCNGFVAVDNTNATDNPSDPIFTCRNVAQTAGNGTMWYRLQPTAVEVTLQTCNSATGPQDSLLQAFSGTCAALGTAIGCDDDNCGTAGDTDFLSTFSVFGLTIGQTYIVEFAGWDAASQGVYQLDVTCAARIGACCVGAACVADRSPEQCFDAGGVWQGEGIACANAICVAAPACPGGGINENEGDCGQPSPDNYNAGPNSASCIFFPDLAGDPTGLIVCGTTSADRRNGSNRDTDWIRFVPAESTQYTACVTGQSGLQVQFWQLGSPFDPCGATSPQNATAGNAGTSICATQCLRGDLSQQYAIRVTPVFNAIGAQLNDPQRLGIGCVSWVLNVTAAACQTGACCNPDLSCTNGVIGVDCLFAGGEYNGDGSACAPGICGGACCLPNGTCAFQSQATCIAAGGSYNAGIPCAEVEPCPICQPEDPNNLDGLAGTQEDCTILGTDVVNSGCTGGAPGTLFSPAECNETVCGVAAFDGGFRDLDWYQVSVATETEFLITVENGLVGGGALLFRFRFYPNQQTPPAGSGDGTPCNTVGAFEVVPAARGNLLPSGITVIPIVVPAGRYTMLVAYDFATPGAPIAACPSNYRVTFDCAAPACAFACEGTAANVENEAACGNPTQTNNGCGGTAPNQPFTALNVGQKACGNVRLVQTTTPSGVSATRDLDWYAINLTAGDYLVDFQAEFHSVFIMTNIGSVAAPVCNNPTVLNFIVFQCGDVTFQLDDLAAGTYGILVAPDFSSYAWFVGPAATAAQELCPAPYQLEVRQNNPCVCADSNCDGFVTVGDIGFFVDAIVGGSTAWANRFLPGTPSCDFTCSNDTNNDGFVTVGDISSFVTAVSTGTPCP
ncbi:MAG: hypothetical protein SF069_17750 [Phycisphaerae bacterium]|nr:hypothetical protein [Phycisphaerae bacterium]